MSIDSRKLAVYGGSAALAAVVIWAFSVTGSPATQRKLADDRQIAKQMECMACYATKYACEDKKGKLPADQKTLLDYMKNDTYCSHGNLNCYSYDYRYDQSNKDTDYSKIKYSPAGDKLTVCGTFHFDAKAQQYMKKSNNHFPQELEEYQKGEQCITFDAHKCNKK